MRYERLIEKVAEMAGVSRKEAKEVIKALPVALMDLQPGKTVRTPLGVFRGDFRPEREVTLPTGKLHRCDPEFVVRLKESVNLTKKV
jgi:nucleoid DNA-binding protein